jgi:hypothetical protein
MILNRWGTYHSLGFIAKIEELSNFVDFLMSDLPDIFPLEKGVCKMRRGS